MLMAPWRPEWTQLARRIEGLERTTRVLSEGKVSGSFAWEGAAKRFAVPIAEGIFAELSRFVDTHRATLGEQRAALLGQWLGFVKELLGKPVSPHGAMASVSGFVSLRSEFEAMSADLEGSRCALVERAFLHLDRSIVVDPRLRETWREAFGNRGETACEGLGAVHLLLHGIWAFKVNAAGERTDLVLQDTLALSADMEAATEALVLTEWKIAHTAEEGDARAAEARAQTNLYTQGSLAATEIRSTRFIVLVSERRIAIPADLHEKAVMFRHVNIAVNPAPPSVVAREAGKSASRPTRVIPRRSD